MRGWIIDLAVGIAIAALIIVVLLFASFDSTFITEASESAALPGDHPVGRLVADGLRAEHRQSVHIDDDVAAVLWLRATRSA